MFVFSIFFVKSILRISSHLLEANAKAISLLIVNVMLVNSIKVFPLTDGKRQDESCVSHSLSVSVNELLGLFHTLH